MTKQIIGQQGEVRIYQIDAIPDDIETKAVARNAHGWVISHSESGHHHVLTGGEVMERTDNIPQGMQMFYAMLDAPAALEQDAAVPHERIELPPGIYMFKTDREFDPFAEQARRVAD